MTSKINIKLIGIKELEYKYLDPTNSEGLLKLQEDSIEGGFHVNYKWNITKELFGIVFKFSYLSVKPDSSKTEFLTLSLLTEFSVENLKDFFTVRSNNDFDINEILETTMVSITISTARGIIFEKTKGTIFQSFPVPLINPSEVILSKKLKKEKPEA